MFFVNKAYYESCKDYTEHAYYLKYQNKRADYLTALWTVVNWETVSSRYAIAIGS